ARVEEVVPAPPRRRIDAPDELREELAEKVGQEDAERMGLARDEAARGAVGSVAELFDHAADPAPRRLPDGPLSIDDAGDGRDGDPRFAGDFLDRAHGRRPRPPRLPGLRNGRGPLLLRS